MSDTEVRIQKLARDILNASGYLLQLRVESEVRDRGHGWRVVSREYPWRDHDAGRARYVDLLIESIAEKTLFVIECKKAKEKNWVFPVEDPRKFDVRDSFFQYVALDDYLNAISRWQRVRFIPSSPEASFCAVQGEGPGTELPMLERTAALLLASLDATGLDVIRLAQRRAEANFVRFLLPAIVTTARLMVCEAKMSRIDLADGEDHAVELLEVPFLRFRKSLSVPDPAQSEARSLEEMGQEGERTVFVVNAASLPEFLRRFTSRA